MANPPVVLDVFSAFPGTISAGDLVVPRNGFDAGVMPTNFSSGPVTGPVGVATGIRGTGALNGDPLQSVIQGEAIVHLFNPDALQVGQKLYISGDTTGRATNVPSAKYPVPFASIKNLDGSDPLRVLADVGNVSKGNFVVEGWGFTTGDDNLLTIPNNRGLAEAFPGVPMPPSSLTRVAYTINKSGGPACNFTLSVQIREVDGSTFLTQDEVVAVGVGAAIVTGTFNLTGFIFTDTIQGLYLPVGISDYGVTASVTVAVNGELT